VFFAYFAANNNGLNRNLIAVYLSAAVISHHVKTLIIQKRLPVSVFDNC